MHSLRKDLMKFKNGGFKKKEEKRKRKEQKNPSVSLSTNITKNRPGNYPSGNHQTDFESVIFSLCSLKKYVAVWVL